MPVEVAQVRGPIETAEAAQLGFPGEERGLWHLLHTRSRQEKTVASDLKAMGIGHFLPLVTQVRHYGRRKLSVDLPLFPGYIFLRGSLDEAYAADRTGRIAQIVRVVDQKQLDWELRNLHLALVKQAPIEPFPYLRVGRRVEVKSGPLRGLQGIIEQRVGACRLVLGVQMLGRGVSLEVDAALLEPVE